MNLRFFTIIFGILILFTIHAEAQTATAPSGSGTEGEPYLISTLDNLYWVSQNVTSWDKYFTQTADIDASSTSGWNGGNGWGPIGNNSTNFSGTYDGGNFSISGLFIDGNNEDYIGLFGRTNSSSAIQNVIIENVSIVNGRYYVGALAGRNHGIITNSSMSGNIDGGTTGDFAIGGLIGGNHGTGTITRSNASGNVIATNAIGVGGLSGYNSGNISESYATGNVYGRSAVGGLIGENDGDASNSYATGNVHGVNTVGGLIGWQLGGILEYNYASGVVNGAEEVGAVLGEFYISDPSNSYWLTDTGNIDNEFGVGLTNSEMRMAASYSGFDFSTIWEIAEAETFPTLQNNTQSPAPGEFPVLAAPFNQAPAAPGTPLFRWLPGNVDTYDLQVSAADDFSSTVISETGLAEAEFQAISSLLPGETYYWRVRGYKGVTPQDWTDANVFTTTLFTAGDGSSESPYEISNAEMLNLVRFDLSAHYILTEDIDLRIATGDPSGIFWNDGAGFDPIGSEADFSGVFNGDDYKIKGLFINRPEDRYIGLFGRVNESGEIKRVGLLDVDITGDRYVGGLAGYLDGGSATENFVTGNVKGDRSVAGLIGRSRDGVISNNYTETNTTGRRDIAGLIGRISDDTISNNFVGGTFTGTNSAIKAIYPDGSTDFASNNYWNSGAVTDDSDLSGTGLNYIEVRKQASFAGFDFDTIWQIDEDRSFPYFQNNVQNPSPGTYPVLESPTGGVTGVPLQPLLSWVSIPTFDSYTLELSTTIDFENIIVFAEALTDTIYQVNINLDLSTTYYWRVRGFENAEASAWSYVSSFTTSEFENGDGSIENPYQISTPLQLDAIRNYLEAHFILIDNVDLSFDTSDPEGLLWNNGSGFEPIGSIYSEYFSGTFNGNGYVINGLFIGGFNLDSGLFGAINETGKVFSLGLSDVDISGIETAAGIAPYNLGEISECFVTGSIQSGSSGGGIAAWNQGLIENSYSISDVSSPHTSGGITAVNHATVINNYVSGSLTASTVLPITQAAFNDAVVSGNVWNSDVITETGSGGMGRTEAEMRQSASFTSFDFENTWAIKEGVSFPYLQAVEPDIYPGVPNQLVSGKSLSFNNGEVIVSHDPIYDDFSELTIEVWVYPEDLSGQKGIIEKHNSPGSGWWVRINNGALQALFVTSGNNPSATASTPLQLNRWQHLAVQYNGNDVQIYIDGQQQDLSTSNTSSEPVINNTNNIQIGKLNWVGTSFFDGKMDEVRIWNKVLTEEEIRQNMFQKLNGDEEGLIAYFPFDEVDTVVALNKANEANLATLGSGVSRAEETHPYGTFISGTEGWRIMSSPVGSSFGDLLQPLWTQGFPGSDSQDNGASNVYYWDEAAQQFTTIADANDIPAAGTGFITYVYDDSNYDGTPDGFPKELRVDNTQNSGSVNPSLSYTDTGTPANNGWNLVGNPYGATIDWDAAAGWTAANIDAAYYIWNSDAGAYQSWNGISGTLATEGFIAPWQGFWVKANAADPQLTLTDDVRSAGGIFLKEKSIPEIQFNLTGNNKSSSAVVMLSDDAQIGKDHLDAYKLQSLNAEFLSLFTQLSDGTALDINALPLELEETISIPVQIDGSSLNGEFELSWKLNDVAADWQLLLSDNETGEKVDMAEHSGFTFQLSASAKIAGDKSNELAVPVHGIISPKVMKSAGLESSRFTLTIIPGQITEIDQTDHLPKEFRLNQNYPNPFNPVTMIDYQLPVVGDVRLDVFDMLGRRVATLVNERIDAGYHQVEFNASHLASGVYLYRLQAGSKVFTKKLTLIK